MLDLQVNLSGFGHLDSALDDAIEAGLDRGAQVVLNAKERQVQKTYSRDIPTSSTGRAKWKRSGAFMEGQSIERGHQSRTITTTGKAADYEERLANLPTGADGVNRTNKAAEEAARITEPQVQVVVESEIANRLPR